MHTNLTVTLPGEDSSPDNHPPLTCLFKAKTSNIWGNACGIIIYILYQKFLQVLFSLGLLSCHDLDSHGFGEG